MNFHPSGPLIPHRPSFFTLKTMGAKGGLVLEQIADLGVLLLLFGIGLKLRIKSLIRPEIWCGTTVHMVITVVVLGAGIYGLGTVGLFAFSGMDLKTSLFVAFALSFSSTVFAVKVLEDKGEIRALHGRTAIGILIMQDIFAVIFLAASKIKLPSLWAVLLFGLFPLRPVLMAIMDRCGHGELLVLFGLFMALVIGAAGFELVGLKADLGALILGALVADHASFTQPQQRYPAWNHPWILRELFPSGTLFTTTTLPLL